MADLVFTGQAAGTALNSNAMPTNSDLAIYRGDYVELLVTVTDDAGVPLNLTGYTAQATMKENYEAANSLPFSCTIPNPATGVVRIYMSTAVSSGLSKSEYVWDFQVVNSSNDARTYLTGDVLVMSQVTA